MSELVCQVAAPVQSRAGDVESGHYLAEVISKGVSYVLCIVREVTFKVELGSTTISLLRLEELPEPLKSRSGQAGDVTKVNLVGHSYLPL